MNTIETIRAEIERLKKHYRIREEYGYGWKNALNAISKFLDTLPEQEHPIYALNQILLDWVREAKTDKEQEARFEAHKRFFELYDEYMVQEPEQPASDGLEEEIKRMVYDVVYDLDGPAIMGTSEYLSVEDIASIARHFAEWGAENLKNKRNDTNP